MRHVSVAAMAVLFLSAATNADSYLTYKVVDGVRDWSLSLIHI